MSPTRKSLSARATEFLDDGDTSDGWEQQRHEDYDDENQDENFYEDDVDDDVELTPMDESPFVARRPKSLVNVLVNDDCVGIVVEEESEEEDATAAGGGGGGYDVVDDDDDDDDVDDMDEVDDVDDMDEVARAGNEALVLIYGHNVNLYTDVFQLPARCYSYSVIDPPPSPTSRSSSSTSMRRRRDLDESIERSYVELREQLTLALGCECYQREAAMVCGYNADAHHDLDPRTYLEIKFDALRRARDILLRDEDSRREYDEMLRRYGNETGGEEEEVKEEEEDAWSSDGQDRDEVK